MKKKNRLIKATMVIDIEFYIDEDTVPEDVLSSHGLCVDSDHGMITEMKLIHAVITRNQKLK